MTIWGDGDECDVFTNGKIVARDFGNSGTLLFG